jgi:DNA-binding MarR family transcriptional regulator
LQQALDHVYQESGMYEGSATKLPVMQDVLNYLETAPVKGRAANWMASTLRAVRSLCFGQMGRVINCEKSLPLSELLSKNVVLELDALEGAEKAFFIDAFLLAIYHCRMNESDREILKHVIILEEAHHVLRIHEGAETVSEVMLREVRELGEGIILIDQHPSLIALTALGNTFCTITMNLKTRADLNAAASYTLLGRDDIHYLGELKVGQGIVKLQDRFVKPFLVNFPLIRIKKGIITDQEVIGKMRGYLADTPPTVPPKVKPKLSPPVPAAEDKNTTTPNSQELSFLSEVLHHPESGIVERIKALGLSRRKVQAIKDALVARGWLETVDVSTGTGRTVLLALTSGGKAILQRSGVATTGYLATGGVEHQFWVKRIAERMVADGFTVTREFKIPGDGSVDLVAQKDGERIAIEVETGQSDVVFNARKCLDAGFDRLILAATTREAYGKLAPRLAAEFSTQDRLEIVWCPSRF